MSSSSTTGIFNVPEPTSADYTTAAQAQANAPNAAVAREVAVAQTQGAELTGQTAGDRLTNDASIRTAQAVDDGKESVAGYVDTAKGMLATAQSYLPPASDVVQGLQTGANVAMMTTKQAYDTAKPYVVAAGEAAKPYVVAAGEAAKPHVQKAVDTAASYMPGTTTTSTEETTTTTTTV
uniref:Uncharacterized protein n=1 Tax=Mycena chlorophos TaxID=658473 RepID=A0ABQ0M7L7_MYCCL|nr:predicted protein [Mycena chlorophos]